MYFINFSFSDYAVGVMSKKFSPLTLGSKIFFSVISKSFTVWSMLNYFLYESDFFFFLPIDVQLFQHHLLKRLYFLWVAFVSLSKISWTYLYGSISGYLFHWPMYLFIHQYHTVLITVTMTSLNTSWMIFPYLFILFQNYLAI